MCEENKEKVTAPPCVASEVEMALVLREHTVESLAVFLKQKGFQDEILDRLQGEVVVFRSLLCLLRC